MKKITLLLLFVITTVSFTYAQTLKLINPHDTNRMTNMVNDSTLVIYGDTGSELISTIWVINSSGFGTMKIEAKRELISVLPGSYNEICWAGTCYPPTISVSPVSENIGHGDTAKLANQFNGDYFPPFNTSGSSTIRYVFYDSINPSDSSWVNVQYVSTLTGISTIVNKPINFSTPYPNPAGSSVNFSYSLANGVQWANMKIYNMLGECVQTLPLNTSKNNATANVQNIPSGIYICEIEASGCKPAYQKMIVSH